MNYDSAFQSMTHAVNKQIYHKQSSPLDTTSFEQKTKPKTFHSRARKQKEKTAIDDLFINALDEKVYTLPSFDDTYTASRLVPPEAKITLFQEFDLTPDFILYIVPLYTENTSIKY